MTSKLIADADEYIKNHKLPENTNKVLELVERLSDALREYQWLPIEEYDKNSEDWIEVICDEYDSYLYPKIRSWSKKRKTWVTYPDCDVNYDYNELDAFKYFRYPQPPQGEE